MFRRNNRRIEAIRQLRSKGLTIDQIDDSLKKQGEKIPRSTIGYYVKKYCSHMDGKQIKTNRVEKKPNKVISRSELYYALSGTLPLRRQPQIISRKSRSMDGIIEREKRKRELGELLNVVLLDLFDNDPDLLSKRLDILVKLLFLAPHLPIDVEEIIDDLYALLGKEKEQSQYSC